MTDASSCAPPRPVATTVLAPDQAPDRQQDISQLNTAGCTLVTFGTALNEFERRNLSERKFGLRPDTWPDGLRACLDRTMTEWLARNASAVVKAMTFGLQGGCAFIELHVRMR